MQTYTARDLRAKLAEALDIVNQGEPVTVTRRLGEDVVILNKSEYEALLKAKVDQELASITGRFGNALKNLAD